MIDILMPRLSDTMTEGAISAWLKEPGDTVNPGDVLVEIETDKALMEQEAYDAGVLAEILVPAGESAPIGTPIARLDDGTGTTPPSVTPPSDTTPARREVASPAPTPRPAADTADRSGRRLATPLVRRIAREHGIDLDRVVGSGPGGRIVRADLHAVTDPPSAPPTTATVSDPQTGDEREPSPAPFDTIRHAIAARLTESATTVPTFTATASGDVTDLLALRAQVNRGSADNGVKVSLNDLLVRAVALALRTHPGVNASYSADGRGQTLQHGRVHIGIAVASPAGLVVPVVRDADRSTVTTIAATTRDLVTKATTRTLTTTEMSDGTFTISNLGMYGVEHFTAIINPPQGAILAVGAVHDELSLVDGEVTSRQRLRYTLTADHRIIDGALAAQFLATLTGLLQDPVRIIA